MEKLIEGIGAFVLLVFLVFIAAVLGGTIVYFLYPSIHSLFPSAAENGIIAYRISWIDSVRITWLFAILIKGTSVSKSKKDKE